MPQAHSKIPHCLTFILALAVSVLFFMPQGYGRADESVSPDAREPARISDVSIINDQTMLYVSFRLVGGFPDQVMGALQSGIPLTFTYELELETPGILMDSTVVSRTISRKIRYDALKGEYMVRYGLHSHRIFMVNNRDEACRLVSVVEREPLIKLSKLSSSETYRLKLRARVEKEKSSIAFTGMLNIFSSWGFTTEWHEVKFNY